MGGSIRKQRLHVDDRAEITGLPLYLMILVVVAGVGLALVLGFTDILAKPPSQFGALEFNPQSPYDLGSGNDASQAYESNIQFSVIVRDSDGGRVDGAVVEAAGSGFNDGAVSQGGDATLDGDITIPAGSQSGTITITVKKDGFPDARSTYLVVRSSS